MTVENSAVIKGYPVEGEVLFASRHPFFKGRPRLGTLRGIRRELAALYAACKAGAVDPSDATKMAFILRSTAATLMEGELEQRIRSLEVIGGATSQQEDGS